MECGGFIKLLGIDVEKHRRIAVVGGGGKTSLIFRLAEELCSTGKKVIITTTTHMAYDPARPYAEAGNWEMLYGNLDRFSYTVTAVLDSEKGKIGSPSAEILDVLPEKCDVLLTEADGAKCFPLKVPESWEPVIPQWTDLVIGVTGLDCLGKSIHETAHRPWNVVKFLKKNESDPVEPEDIIKIARSRNGLRKSVENRDYRVYLNKFDALKTSEIAEKICGNLKEQGIYAACGTLKE